jgi:hypothetical protein
MNFNFIVYNVDDNIKMVLWEIGRINLAQDVDQWRDLVKTVLSHRVP